MCQPQFIDHAPTDASNLVLRLLMPLLRLLRPLLVVGALSAVAASCARAMPRPPVYPVPTGSVLLSAYNFDTPLAPTSPISVSNGWTVFQQAPGLVRSQMTNPRPAHGRFEVVPGAPLVANGPRAEIRANPTIPDGTVTQSCGRWYIPSYSDLPGPFHSWQILYQEHPTGSPSNPLFAHPAEALFVLGTKGRPYGLRLASGTGRRLDWQSAPGAFLPNTWHSFCVRALWSPLQTGWVQLWIDGTWQKLKDGRTRKYQVTMPSDRHYTLDGIYDGDGRANQQHSVTYMANIQIWSLPAS